MLDNIRILLVADREFIKMIKSGLEDQGYEVIAFDRASDALRPDVRQFTVALIDVQIPNINGFELAGMLWQKNERLQVCFLSAIAVDPIVVIGNRRNLRSYCFLTMPITLSALSNHIKTHFVNG